MQALTPFLYIVTFGWGVLHPLLSLRVLSEGPVRTSISLIGWGGHHPSPVLSKSCSGNGFQQNKIHRWSAPGIEPGTSCTRSRNHASRPSGQAPKITTYNSCFTETTHKHYNPTHSNHNPYLTLQNEFLISHSTLHNWHHACATSINQTLQPHAPPPASGNMDWYWLMVWWFLIHKYGNGFIHMYSTHHPSFPFQLCFDWPKKDVSIYSPRMIFICQSLSCFSKYYQKTENSVESLVFSLHF